MGKLTRSSPDRNQAKQVHLVVRIQLMFTFCICFADSPAANAHDLVIASPNRSISLKLALPLSGRPSYSAKFNGRPIILDSHLGISFSNALPLARDLELQRAQRSTVDEEYELIAGPQRKVRNHCNQILVHLRERNVPHRQLELLFRAYDYGIAFRYILPRQPNCEKPVLQAEETTFHLPPYSEIWALNLGTYRSNYEGEYIRRWTWELRASDIIGLPALIKTSTNFWIGVLEANIQDYPGLYLSGTPGQPEILSTKLAALPNQPVASLNFPFQTPWRVLLMGEYPGRLIEHNTLLTSLNPPCAIADTSWIKPGKATWHWWNGTLTGPGTGIKAGMNDATFRYYLDFAADHGFQYFQIDDGWYPNVRGSHDVMHSIPEIHVPELVRYAETRNVGILLWVDWRHIEKHLDATMALYQSWGIKGVKVDFMNRDDQWMVNFYRKVVECAAAHRLLVNFHGAYKPDGMQRTWPNLITREAVLGLEWNRFSRRCTPIHDVTLPFTRMLAGPMDYTPGAFRTSSQEAFKPLTIEPTAQGTRAHQLAMYVVYESPLQTLADYPEAYRNQPGISFLQSVPTTWDETLVIEGEVGRFITMARRKDHEWYIGSMAAPPVQRTIGLGFLGPGSYLAEIYSDGKDVARDPTQISINAQIVNSNSRLTLNMAAGGGQAIRIRPSNP